LHRARKRDGRTNEEKPKDPQAVKFGQWLDAERRKKGMNQTELAKATGISQPQVSRIKRGEDNASADTVRDLAKALGVPQVVALIEAGYITDLSPELAALAAEVERLPDVERRAVIAAIAGMVSALGRRTG
jgi:transcriptional regulator with XRE-family HTH domain